MSLTAVHCLALGQTALFTTGLLGAAIVATRTGSTWASAAPLFLLTMKPPLALVAGAALLASGHRRPVALAAGGALVVVAATVGWWTVAAIGDYVRLVRTYNLVEADPLFRAGYVPGLMSNLRNALLQLASLDDARASGVSSLVFALALVLPVLGTLATGRPAAIAASFSWMILSYALFAPHLSSTEDVVLLLPMLLLWPSPGAPASVRQASAALALAPQFIGGSAAVFLHQGEPVLPLLAFAAKLAFAACAATTLAASRRERAPG